MMNPKREVTTMVRENPLSIFIIFLIVVVAVVGQMIGKKSGLELTVEGHSGFCAVPVLVLAVLVALAFVVWRWGQPWKK